MRHEMITGWYGSRFCANGGLGIGVSASAAARCTKVVAGLPFLGHIAKWGSLSEAADVI